MRVRNIKSPQSGRPVANQYVIYNYDNVYFQSYNTTIAWIDKENKVYLNEGYWDMYSATTNKYLLEFMRDQYDKDIYSITDIRERVKNGEFNVLSSL
jgi:hypothetical protein